MIAPRTCVLRAVNIASLTYEAVSEQMARGARFVTFPVVVSFLLFSVTFTTRTYYVEPGKKALGYGWPWLVLTCLFGWWSHHGIVRTPGAIARTLRGGDEVGYAILTRLNDARPAGERVDRPRYV